MSTNADTDHDADAAEVPTDDRPRRRPAPAEAKATTASSEATPRKASTRAKAATTKAATTKAATTKAPAKTTATKATSSAADRGVARRRAATPATAKAATTTTTTPASAPSPAGPRRLPWILAAVGLLGTLVFGGLWLSARGDDGGGAADGDAAVAVKEAADGFSLALTNFDGATIDADFDRIVALSTGDFRDEVGSFFSTDTRAQLKEAQASSRGEVRSSYVQGVDGERASAFVVLDQTIANNKSPQPKADTLRMELALQLVDGTWLVQQVNVLEAPSGGATIDLDPAAPTATTTTVPGG